MTDQSPPCRSATRPDLPDRMIIPGIVSFLSEKYPIASFEHPANPGDFYLTFGPEEFTSCLAALGFLPDDVAPEWRAAILRPRLIQPSVWRFGLGLQSFDLRTGWRVRDFYDDLIQHVLWKAQRFDSLCAVPLPVSPNSILYNATLFRDIRLPDLYFTSHEYFRERILSGEQRFRWFDYYRGLKSDGVKSDPAEGAMEAESFSGTYVNRGLTLKNIRSAHIRSDGILFSLHDDKILLEQKRAFGNVTYRVLDIDRWALKIIEDSAEHFMRDIIAPSPPDNCKPLIGVIAYLGQVQYSRSRTKQSKRSVEDFFIRNMEPGAKVRFEDSAYIKRFRGPLPDPFTALRGEMLTKPDSYSAQSEWRLIVQGICADTFGAEYLFNPMKTSDFPASGLCGTCLATVR